MTTKPTVLVTDDDEDLRLLCQMALQGGGFRVALAANGDEAFEVASEERPDLILLDLMMPVKDGWECLTDLKDDSSLRDIPVFVLTGKVLNADKTRALTSGAEAFITKPFHTPELVARIRERLAN